MPTEQLSLDREASWRVIEAQRRAIADLLAGLTPEEWAGNSLCAGWRIRDVAAHLALTPRVPSIREMVVASLRARGDYNRMIHQLTTDYAEHPVTQLVSDIRDNAAARTLPKLTNYRNILFDTMVHGQDIAIPLGRTLDIPPLAAAVAAQRAASIGWPVFDRHRLDGIRLCASDIDWSYGTGREVRGPSKALLLFATGRTALRHELTGDGLALVSKG
ncbi:maleylpyruvate isomerase family mycothiol-dependent enzyme [Nocardia sp. NPDC050712]|uniref:maleylpyruvate isomerase family mycothiol-dependent enzyme n=1 Tax=Nocardia sp. NPDC050712 TaxID=3155518 RepID=UPI0033F36D7E